MKAVVKEDSLQWPSIFSWLQEKGNVETHEMYRTFNCGVGLVLAVNQGDAEAITAEFNALGETAWIIGDIAARDGDEAQVEMV